MTFHEQLVECPDGRVLEVATLGRRSNPTVFFHHGTPGSSRSIRGFDMLIDVERFFIVTTSRAGYGASTRLEGRNVASVVDDVHVVLDALGREEYVALGWSGGGPHALACGVLDAPRCQKVVSVASVVPIDADIDWTEGMGPENLEEFALAKEGGAAYEAYIETASGFMAAMEADTVIEIFGGLFSQPDQAFLHHDARRARFAEGVSYGFSKDWRGFYDDNVAFFQSWGFDPADLTVPAALYYGGDDLMVPPTHGAWLSTRLRTAATHAHRGEGHLSIFEHCRDELVADLANVAS